MRKLVRITTPYESPSRESACIVAIILVPLLLFSPPPARASMPGSHSKRSGGKAKVAWVLSIFVVASRARELLAAAAHSYGTEALVPAHVGSQRCAGFLPARWWLCGAGMRPRSSNAWGENNHSRPRIRMGVGAGREELGGPRPKQKRALALLATGINDAILEMCVENKGRPLARSMTDFVEYTIEVLASGEQPMHLGCEWVMRGRRFARRSPANYRYLPGAFTRLLYILGHVG